jgi:hypothetical protein
MAVLGDVLLEAIRSMGGAGDLPPLHPLVSPNPDEVYPLIHPSLLKVVRALAGEEEEERRASEREREKPPSEQREEAKREEEKREADESTRSPLYELMKAIALLASSQAGFDSNVREAVTGEPKVPSVQQGAGGQPSGGAGAGAATAGGKPRLTPAPLGNLLPMGGGGAPLPPPAPMLPGGGPIPGLPGLLG